MSEFDAASPRPRRTLIFDVGGVLFHPGKNDSLKPWELKLGLSAKDLFSRVLASEASVRAFEGKATAQEVWDEVQVGLQLTTTELTAFRASLWGGGEWDTTALQIIKSLRPTYRTVVLSNAWAEARAEQAHILDGETFDHIIYSAEIGVSKPHQDAYTKALDILNVKATDCWFVDDRSENIQTAMQLGIEVHRFVEPRVLHEVLRDFKNSTISDGT